jgi:hypothetical protein
VENEDTGLCSSCGIAIRKADRLAMGEKKKPKGIKPRSEKKKAQDKIYNSDVDTWIEENPNCKAMLIGCTGLTSERHHVSGRGINTNKKETWLPVCRNCHDQIHNVLSAEVRREKGLLV